MLHIPPGVRQKRRHVVHTGRIVVGPLGQPVVTLLFDGGPNALKCHR